jgi:nucleoside-diphosphate-sugar epimerase
MLSDLVTGGVGLTGRALVTALLAAGRRVRVLDQRPHPDPRVESLVGDVRDPAAVGRAVVGVDTVFHTVAVVSQHPALARLIHDVNVGGTRLLLAASRAAGVPRFVFTSSIDVVFDGRPIADGDESLPYPRRYLDDYARSKALAEQEVLRAGDPRHFATCSLRAAGIFGAHDQHRFPVLIDFARRFGFFALGDGRARFSNVYVDNLAHAHVLAARALAPGSTIAGRAYFITDHAPVNFFDFATPYLAELGIRRARFSMPEAAAWAAACSVEGLYAVAGRAIEAAPTLTRYAVAATCRDFWFNHAAARRDFGYEPVVSADDAYRRTLAWLRERHRARGGARIAADPIAAPIVENANTL